MSASNEISVDVKVSADADNIIVAKPDGLYAPSAAAAISTKADKVANAVNGNFAGLDANGNLTDSGKKATDFDAAGAAAAVQGATTETVKTLSDKIDVINGADTVTGSIANAVKALADGAVKTNTDAIAAINDPTTGAVATAKDYANGLNTAMDTRVTAVESASTNFATTSDIDSLF